MIGLATLALASLKSVLSVAACASVGLYARRYEIVSEAHEKVFDKLVSSIFLPCLILGRMTPHFNLAELLAIWPLALMCLCIVLFGLAAGAAAASALRLPEFRGLMMTAIAFPNSFAVPLTLMSALGPHPVLTEGDAAKSADVATLTQNRVDLLFLTSYAIWILARWGIGFPILSGAISLREWKAKVLNPPFKACVVAASAGLCHQWLSNMLGTSAYLERFQLLEPFRTAVLAAGRCSVPVLLMALGMKLDSALRDMLATPESKSADLEKQGMVPTTLGARDETEPSTGEQGIGETSASMPLSAHLAVFILRQVGGPIVGMLLALGFLRDLCGFTDRVVLMVGMLQACGPPMINLSVMAGVSGTAEKDTAKLLLITYGLSIFTWTVCTVLFLNFLQT